MPVPNPTPIFRLTHVDNLGVCLARGALHAPKNTPNDGLCYRTIHREDVQTGRRDRQIPCGPRGFIHDYVPFYFGYLSPMLLQLKTGQVPGYSEGQEPLVYLVSTAQFVHASGASFVFSDGHGLAEFTKWFEDLRDLDKVDWDLAYERYWRDSLNDMDRQRRKQAEFLVHRTCDWALIRAIGVIDEAMKRRVEEIQRQFLPDLQRPVEVRREWYYW